MPLFLLICCSLQHTSICLSFDISIFFKSVSSIISANHCIENKSFEANIHQSTSFIGSTNQGQSFIMLDIDDLDTISPVSARDVLIKIEENPRRVQEILDNKSSGMTVAEMRDICLGVVARAEASPHGDGIDRRGPYVYSSYEHESHMQGGLEWASYRNIRGEGQQGSGRPASGRADRVRTQGQGGLGAGTAGFGGLPDGRSGRMPQMFGQGSQRGTGGMEWLLGADSRGGMEGIPVGYERVPRDRMNLRAGMSNGRLQEVRGMPGRVQTQSQGDLGAGTAGYGGLPEGRSGRMPQMVGQGSQGGTRGMEWLLGAESRGGMEGMPTGYERAFQDRMNLRSELRMPSWILPYE